ncbi:MAG: indolepyruvate oxidoreductase subunit beta [Rikenellaceae bacterium]|nr:indolepyruvate oxidoreductase subunit beta [Rikenellaceae bacterium]
MKRNIILSGVGGQGILSIATVIGQAALDEGLSLKQAEVHGMSQRGGDVQSHLRISSEPIASDLISRGGGDVILSLEPMEALRYLPYRSEGGWVVANTAPFVNIPNYPDIEGVLAELRALPQAILLDVDAIAKDGGVTRAANIVLLGAASSILGLSFENLADGIRKIFGAKGETVVAMNLKALEAGRDTAQKLKNEK